MLKKKKNSNNHTHNQSKSWAADFVQTFGQLIQLLPTGPRPMLIIQTMLTGNWHS